jgi:hypothetical protein
MPIKRNDSLKPLSRDHHHGLLLSWKIRTGLTKKIEPKRIKHYSDWFYQNHLKPHFEIEEKYLFPTLDHENAFVKKALSDHQHLTQLFEKPIQTSKDLGAIADELENQTGLKNGFYLMKYRTMRIQHNWKASNNFISRTNLKITSPIHFGNDGR